MQKDWKIALIGFREVWKPLIGLLITDASERKWSNFFIRDQNSGAQQDAGVEEWKDQLGEIVNK